MSKKSEKVAAFSANNPVISVEEMRIYGNSRAENPETSKGFENLDLLTDDQILKIIGNSNTPRKAKYRVSGVVGMSVSFQMKADWAKLIGQETWEIEENSETLQLRRYQKSKI